MRAMISWVDNKTPHWEGCYPLPSTLVSLHRRNKIILLLKKNSSLLFMPLWNFEESFCEIILHADHKNLTYSPPQFTTKQVPCWHLCLEEFHTKFIHLNGSDNVLVDALRCVPLKEAQERKGTSLQCSIIITSKPRTCWQCQHTMCYQHNVVWQKNSYQGHFKDLFGMPKQDVLPADSSMNRSNFRVKSKTCWQRQNIMCFQQISVWIIIITRVKLRTCWQC